MSPRLTVLSLYGRVARTYAAWVRALLAPTLVVFVPLGLVEALSEHVEIGERELGDGFLLAGVIVALLALVGMSILGQIFYSGIVAAYLTHDERHGRPSLGEIASGSSWGSLLAVDLIFAALVLAGFILFLLPGVVFYVWFTLAGPIVELERRGARGALARSRELVRGRFWLVLAVVAPIELGSEALGEGAAAVAGALLGTGLAAEWLASAAANTLLSPFLAIALVLLTAGLIAERGERAPRLHSAPMVRR